MIASMMLLHTTRGPLRGRARFALTIGLAAMGALVALPRTAAAQAPPGTGTDMEIDPDAKPPPPPPPEEKKEVELPPVEQGAWGVGGKEEEGKFAPAGKKKDTAENDGDVAPTPLPPPGAFGLDLVIGFGDSIVAEEQTASGASVASFVAGLSYRFGDTWSIGARFPYSTGSTMPPAAQQAASTYALGNLELAVRPSFVVGKHWRIPAGFALDLPLASGDLLAQVNDTAAIAQGNVAYVAAQSRGWEDNALFASKSIGVVPSVGLAFDKGSIHAGAQTKLEIMGRTGGVKKEEIRQATPVAIELHDPLTNWVTGLSFFYDFLGGKVQPGLRLWMALARLPVSSGTRNYSGAQFVVEPDVRGRIPVNAKGDVAITASLGLIQPLGGPLGGSSSSMHGVRIDAGLQF